MVGLAIDIVAFLIVAWAVLAVLALVFGIGAGIVEWLYEVPGRRKRVWWTIGAVSAAAGLFLWWALAPHTADIALAIAASLFGAYLLIGWVVIVVSDAIRGWRP